jgi:large subunit ribosomal protein L25
MAEASEWKAEARDRVGKGAARQLRREDKIPAVIYGDKQTPVTIALNHREASRRLHAGGFLTHVVTLDIDGQKHRVIPRDYQLDPVRDQLVHVDFLRVSATSKITVEVPVHFLNPEASPGIKRGGVLNIVRHEVELTCPADAIPEYLEVDLTGREIGDSIHISAVNLPADAVPTIKERDFTIATIAAPAVLPEETEEAAGAEGEEKAEG